MNLNAGCGCDSWGDVRVDVQHYSDLFFLKNTSVNVIASIEYLPFRDNVFGETHCFHVLEHVDYPFCSIMEIIRVTNGKLLIKVPVNHFYSYLIEFLALWKYLILTVLIGPSFVKNALLRIKNLKPIYSTHKRYIKGRKINRVYFVIPLEYEILLRCC